jgi:hypothetical protein
VVGSRAARRPVPLGRQSAISQSLEREGRSYGQPIFFINKRCLHVRGHSKLKEVHRQCCLVYCSRTLVLSLFISVRAGLFPLLIAVAQAILVIFFYACPHQPATNLATSWGWLPLARYSLGFSRHRICQPTLVSRIDCRRREIVRP